METQKLVNLINRRDLQLLSALSFMIKTVQTMVKAILMLQALNLGLKISNQVFVII